MKPPRLSATQRSVLQALADDKMAYICNWEDESPNHCYLYSREHVTNIRDGTFYRLLRSGHIRHTGRNSPCYYYKLTDAGALALALGKKVQANV